MACGLMSLSVIAAAPSIHHEAIDWATRVSANGGTISTTVLRAVSDFCAAIDRNSLRDRFARLSIFSGGNLSGSLVPLYRSFSYGGTLIGSATDTNVNFVSGDFAETGATGGLKGNGTNKHLATGLGQSSLGTGTNLHLSASATSLESVFAGSNRIVLGAFNTGNSGLMQLYAVGSPGRMSQIGSNGGVSPVITSPTSVESHFIGVRRSVTDGAIYSGGSLAGTNTSLAASQNYALPFFVFATNVNGVASSFSAARMRLYSIGLGMTNAQAAAFSAAVAALNTALGR
jgi:hypothetical protein